MGWSLYQYQNAFNEVYDQCDQDTCITIDHRAGELMQHGNQTKPPISKPLGKGLFELVAKNVRFLYFFQPGKKIIIVLGAFKDQRTLPKRIIDRARDIRDTLLSEPELMNELTKIH